jgi:segregation and condensation protein A
VTPATHASRSEELLVVEIDRFHGPMDLLLHLIRQQDIDIFDIPISRITRQFLLAVEGLHAMELDSAGEFLETAATLVRIKARMLLPSPVAEGEEDPRAELVRRLLEYEQIREITRRLEGTEADRSRRFRKGYLPVRPNPAPEDTPLETTWREVLEAAAGIRTLDPADREHRVTPRTISMEEKSQLILEMLHGVGRIEFRRLLGPFKDRMHGVMTLLAGLELSRRRRVRLKQAAPFHELWLYAREEEEPSTRGSP